MPFFDTDDLKKIRPKKEDGKEELRPRYPGAFRVLKKGDVFHPSGRVFRFKSFDISYEFIFTYTAMLAVYSSDTVGKKEIDTIFGWDSKACNKGVKEGIRLLYPSARRQLEKFRKLPIEEKLFGHWIRNWGGYTAVEDYPDLVLPRYIANSLQMFYPAGFWWDGMTRYAFTHFSTDPLFMILVLMERKYNYNNLFYVRNEIIDHFIDALNTIKPGISEENKKKVNKILAAEHVNDLPKIMSEINADFVQMMVEFLQSKKRKNLSGIFFFLTMSNLFLMNAEEFKDDIDVVYNEILYEMNVYSDNYTLETKGRKPLETLGDFYTRSDEVFKYYHLAQSLNLPKLRTVKTRNKFFITMKALLEEGTTELVRKRIITMQFLRELKEAVVNEAGISWLDRYVKVRGRNPIPPELIEKAFRRLPKLVEKYGLNGITLNALLFNPQYRYVKTKAKNKKFLMSPFFFVMDDNWYFKNVLAVDRYIKQKFSPELMEYVADKLGINLVNMSTAESDIIESKYKEVLSALNSLINMAAFFERYCADIGFVSFQSYINRAKYRKKLGQKYLYDDFLRDIIDFISDNVDQLTPRMLNSASKYVKQFFERQMTDINQPLPGERYFEIYHEWRKMSKVTYLVFAKKPIPKEVQEKCPSLRNLGTKAIMNTIIINKKCWKYFEENKLSKYFILLEPKGTW